MGTLKHLKELPYDELRRAIHLIRREWFSRSMPDVNGLLLDIEPEEFEDILVKKYHYESASRYSMEFDTEVVNVRTPYGLDSEDRQRENHIRLFEIDSEDYGCFCLVHHECSRFEHWEEHVNEVDLSWDRGIEITTNIADDEDIDYQEMDTSKAYDEHHNGDKPDIS